ncbi:MAG: hypothetical protein ACO1OB_30175 [Archangium sp.]
MLGIRSFGIARFYDRIKGECVTHKTLLRVLQKVVVIVSMCVSGSSAAANCKVSADGGIDNPGEPCDPFVDPTNELIFNTSDGRNFESGMKPTGVMSVSRYRTATDVADIQTTIKKYRSRIVAEDLDKRALQTKWSTWSGAIPAFASFTCTLPGLRRLKTDVMNHQRFWCDENDFRGLERRAACSWLADVLAATDDALKPVGQFGNIVPTSSCALIESLKTSLDTTKLDAQVASTIITRIALVEAMDKVLVSPETACSSLLNQQPTDCAGTQPNQFRVFEIRNEFHTTKEISFVTVPFNNDAVGVNPGYDRATYVRISGYDLNLDLDVEWTAEFEDPARSLKTAAGFLGFVIASYGRQSLDMGWVPADDGGKTDKATPSLGKPLEHRKLATAVPFVQQDVLQEVLNRLPPENSKGVRFVGPILPEPNTRYVLTIQERAPKDGKRSTLAASQTVEYVPRASTFVTITAGVSADFLPGAVLDDRSTDPLSTHEWVPVEVGATTTSFRRESTRRGERIATPFVGVIFSPPLKCFNRDWGRLMFQFSVGIPLNQPRGVAQYGFGFGWWWRSGISLALSLVLRFYEQAVSSVGGAQLVLANVDGRPPTPPSIATREAVTGGVGASLGFDLHVAGTWFVQGAKNLFSGGAK